MASSAETKVGTCKTWTVMAQLSSHGHGRGRLSEIGIRAGWFVARKQPLVADELTCTTEFFTPSRPWVPVHEAPALRATLHPEPAMTAVGSCNAAASRISF